MIRLFYFSFKKRRKQTNFKPPVFKIWRESNEPRTLFAIPNTELYNHVKHYERSTMISTALNKYALIDLPESQLAWFSYSNGARNNYKDWSTAKTFVSSEIKYTQTAEQINFETLLLEGTKFFEDKKGGVFVIIIGGKDIISTNSETKVTEICRKLRDFNVKLKIILFPVLTDYYSMDSRKHSSQLFEAAISVTGGQVFNIREDIQSLTYKSSMSTAFQIIQALGTVLTDHSGDTSQSYHLIREQVFNDLGNTPKTVSFEFQIDESMSNRDLRVYFIQSRVDPVHDTDVVLNDFKLYDPSHTETLAEKFKDTFGYIQGFKLNVKNMFGVWNFTGQVSPKSGDSLVAVAEFSTTRFDDDVITAECWLNTNIEFKHSDGPIIAYVNLRDSLGGLVSDVSVELFWTLHPEKPGLNSTYDKILMIDDGKGDPDITQGDGIYSQYIVNIRNMGYYTVNAVITSDKNILVTKDFGSTSLSTNPEHKPCCGSKVRGTIQTLRGPLKRTVECGSFLSTTNNNPADYPPNSVRDLQIETTDYDNRTVTLRWTSTGGDYTSSNVNRYEIKAFIGSENNPQKRREIKERFDSIGSQDIDIIANSPKQSYGEEERALVKINSEEGGIYLFALRAVDHIERKSVVSNIVIANIKSNVKIQSTTAFAIDVSIHPGTPISN